MSPLFGKKKNPGQPYWSGRTATVKKEIPDGWRFTLKGSPRHYDDVTGIIESDPDATVYFGEALTYERGAGVALWRVSARSFAWLPRLYEWWAEAERIEPIIFTFHLYMTDDINYPVLDLREYTPDQVEAYIKEHAPRSAAEARALTRRN